jgi:two-component system nitrate/nitrite response regulator NarL
MVTANNLLVMLTAVRPAGATLMITDSTDASGVRVLVVDDIRLYRDNLIMMLRQEPTIAGAAGASGGDDALRQLSGRGFEVVLLNMATTDSLAICRELAAATPVVALAVSGSDDEVVACAEAGVAGYLLRDQPKDALVKVIATAARGVTSCPPEVAAALMRRMGRRGGESGLPTGTARLTGREREILDLIDQGMSNKEIGQKLFIEVRTVKNHVHNLLEKLSVHRRGEAAALLRSHRRPFGG